MRIVLHIGLEKTGSTAIQAFCARHADALRADGILYPSGLGDRNHVHLAMAAANFPASRDIRLRVGIHDEAALRAFTDRALRSLKAEIDRARPHTLLLSSEHFSSRLLADPPLRRLHAMLSALAAEIRVIVYLRRQDETLLSLYSTFAKCGGTDPLEAFADRPIWLDFERVLGLWEGVFGTGNLDVRIFPPRDRPLLDDFRAAADLPEVAGTDDPAERHNAALDHRNTQLLIAMNREIPTFVDGRVNPARRGLVRFLEARSTGPPLTMPRKERAAFLARFACGNEAVRARFFPDRNSLFANELDDTPAPPDVSREDAVELAADIWADRAVIARRLDRRKASGLRGLIAGLRRRLHGLRRRRTRR